MTQAGNSRSCCALASYSIGEVLSRAYTLEVIQESSQYLMSLSPTLLAYQASGSLEHDIVLAVSWPKLLVVIVHARHFARVTGRLTRIDPFDTMMLARFAVAVQPDVRRFPSHLIHVWQRWFRVIGR